VNINPQSNTDFTQVTCTVHFYYNPNLPVFDLRQQIDHHLHHLSDSHTETKISAETDTENENFRSLPYNIVAISMQLKKFVSYNLFREQ
jgi:hypothetical protein